MSNLQIILIVYLLVTLFSALFLMLPISQQANQNVKFIDALFIAASAFSDTGLTTHTTATTWSDFGLFIIAFLISLGGIGIFALKVYVLNIVFKKPISIFSKNILEKERGANNSGELKRTIKISINFLIISLIISTLILWPIFYWENGQFVWIDGHNIEQDFSRFNPKGNSWLSLKCAIFHSITAINNAGFDILSNNSLYPYYHVYSLQIVFIILIVIGGIGYPVIYDTIQFLIHKMKHRTDFQFSLFTKLSTITYLLTLIIGFLLTITFDVGNASGIWHNNQAGSYNDKMMAIIFHVFSTRSAGFTTLDPTIIKFSNSSLVVFAIMMFIGCAPSSTGGGIRTTTLAIVVIAIWNRFKGISNVRAFKRNVETQTVYSSFVVLSISAIIVLMNVLICSTSYNTMWGSVDSNEISFADIFYDVCSAFGTTGLSTGMVSGINSLSKIVLSITMFLGQLGISSTMLVWRPNNPKNNLSFIEENVLIG